MTIGAKTRNAVRCCGFLRLFPYVAKKATWMCAKFTKMLDGYGFTCYSYTNKVREADRYGKYIQGLSLGPDGYVPPENIIQRESAAI